ncbi:hypothetical protein DEU56DRAFT_837646 [Suillus clintonianus]|uniref:uncharacterized protein n=1 Tax=Suillus clintonianus TaxID=1904413 RepID=UPI001B883408|nr:uncharacterized protein DEU56DRAFT_837646 [Suillus clintonianus]KAG2118458.1 hypothetical protein DEU56DRAFT_837646 [Suillus clintonianus]
MSLHRSLREGKRLSRTKTQSKLSRYSVAAAAQMSALSESTWIRRFTSRMLHSSCSLDLMNKSSNSQFSRVFRQRLSMKCMDVSPPSNGQREPCESCAPLPSNGPKQISKSKRRRTFMSVAMSLRMTESEIRSKHVHVSNCICDDYTLNQ